MLPIPRPGEHKLSFKFNPNQIIPLPPRTSVGLLHPTQPSKCNSLLSLWSLCHLWANKKWACYPKVSLGQKGRKVFVKKKRAGNINQLLLTVAQKKACCSLFSAHMLSWRHLCYSQHVDQNNNKLWLILCISSRGWKPSLSRCYDKYVMLPLRHYLQSMESKEENALLVEM